MRYLGIDYGAKRIGLAVSDEEGKMAFPYEVVLNQGDIVEKMGEIIEKEKIDKIVVGESKNFEGEPNKIMKDIEKFVLGIKAGFKVEIIFEPEFLTSVQAKKSQPESGMRDASAAAIILQSYLDRM